MPEQLDAAGRDLALEAEQRDADLKAVMETPTGRRFVKRLLERGRLNRESYAGELTHATAYNEGVRQMAQTLDNELQHKLPALWLLMHQENPPKLVHPGPDASAS